MGNPPLVSVYRPPDPFAEPIFCRTIDALRYDPVRAWIAIMAAGVRWRATWSS